jgi:hypothetical protein
MDKVEIAILALRKAAEAVELCPIRRSSLLGGYMIQSHILRDEADWLEKQRDQWKIVLEED